MLDSNLRVVESASVRQSSKAPQKEQTPMSPPFGRRSKMEAYYDILSAIEAGEVRATAIMYRTNLSWSVLKSYTRALESQGLILRTDEQGAKQPYRLSEKGFKILDEFRSIRNAFDSQSTNSEITFLEQESVANIQLIRTMFDLERLTEQDIQADIISEMKGLLNEYTGEKTDAVEMIRKLRDGDSH